ncbi:hypothetical protein AMECASPLE_027129 [Ameca splendens]|uniref:Uncharacterized protein n=1 Tax=Ameca splendens TaxID=208324 RepID=A0ABV1A332_9TELE
MKGDRSIFGLPAFITQSVRQLAELLPHGCSHNIPENYIHSVPVGQRSAWENSAACRRNRSSIRRKTSLCSDIPRQTTCSWMFLNFSPDVISTFDLLSGLWFLLPCQCDVYIANWK